ncbi:pectinesterase family protein [Paractinoplanes rishiriensis]|uniref:Pectinesterase n=1 Tax=Paractinoplanes rishiriensis TaxID=1050105 RepID=A0A919K5W5_9ACTN|nr:pectinesterase family protein [Actinoplanes rishiriensis]GIE99304.1 pectinesterase [Actinoplanes rishiriensis]
MHRRKFLELAGGSAAGVLVAAGGAAPAAAAPGRRPFAVVAADGSGDFATVQAAVDAVPAGNTERLTIAIRPGTYLGQVIVSSTKPFITLLGTGRNPEHVVVADNRANGTPKPDGSGTWGTSGSASVTVDGAGFTARNLTFANTFDEVANPDLSGKQAVAILTRADKLEFERVRFIGNQDTLYVNSSAAGVIARAYFRDCYVEGDVDFIFGRGTGVFDRCRIHSLNRNTTPAGYVTAPSTDIANPHGLLFNRCTLSSDAPAGSVFLGRPWHPSNDPNAIGQTIIRESWLGEHIGATPWSNFGTWPWQDARFGEFHNRGPGALVTADRPQLTDEQAATATVADFLRGTDNWRPESCR